MQESRYDDAHISGIEVRFSCEFLRTVLSSIKPNETTSMFLWTLAILFSPIYNVFDYLNIQYLFFFFWSLRRIFDFLYLNIFISVIAAGSTFEDSWCLMEGPFGKHEQAQLCGKFSHPLDVLLLSHLCFSFPRTRPSNYINRKNKSISLSVILSSVSFSWILRCWLDFKLVLGECPELWAQKPPRRVQDRRLPLLHLNAECHTATDRGSPTALLVVSHGIRRDLQHRGSIAEERDHA